HVDQPYTGVLNSEHEPGIDRSHACELIELFRLAICVESHIEEQTRCAVFFWDDGGDCRTNHAFERLNAEQCAHQHGAGVACAHECVGVSGGKHLKPNGDGRFWFFLQCLCRMLVHVYHLCGWHEFVLICRNVYSGK